MKLARYSWRLLLLCAPCQYVNSCGVFISQYIEAELWHIHCLSLSLSWWKCSGQIERNIINSGSRMTMKHSLDHLYPLAFYFTPEVFRCSNYSDSLTGQANEKNSSGFRQKCCSSGASSNLAQIRRSTPRVHQLYYGKASESHVSCLKSSVGLNRIISILDVLVTRMAWWPQRLWI